jgi:hypothetical protein
MAVHTVDALTDERWEPFLSNHPQASVFHTTGWLKSLWLTYRHKPFILTTSGPRTQLSNGLVFCEVKSWITGRRLVSLPFSDHCDLLTDSDAHSDELLTHLAGSVGKVNRYAEIRPLSRQELPRSSWSQAESLCLHILPLELPLEVLFRNLHKNCIQRKIHRAEREDLQYLSGRSESLLQQFYKLLLRTRLRHHLPPQPIEWFRNLVKCMGNQLTIRIALKDGRAIASLLTLSYKNTITYKYGCSDERFNSLGGTPFLFWKTIQEAKSDGMLRLDLGRSEVGNKGLTTFKDRLGAERSTLTYSHSSAVPSRQLRPVRLTHFAKRFFPHLPTAVLHLPTAFLSATGKLLYRHMD